MPALVSWMPQVVSQRCQWCPRPLQPGCPRCQCLLWGHSVAAVSRWATVCVGVFVLGIAPGPPTYLICPLTLAANCDAAAICTLGCGCELIVMGPSASISLVIGRWVRPRGAKSPVPAFRRCLSPRLLVTAVITFTHHIRHHLLLAVPIQKLSFRQWQSWAF